MSTVDDRLKEMDELNGEVERARVAWDAAVAKREAFLREQFRIVGLGMEARLGDALQVTSQDRVKAFVERLRVLRQPFLRRHIDRLLGWAKSTTNSYLNRAMKQGFLTQTFPGEYMITKKTGNTRRIATEKP